MSTTGAAPDSAARGGVPPATRIVRICRAAPWPTLAALVVLGTVGLAVPHDAWLPFAPGPAVPGAWESPAGWPLDRLSRLQLTLGSRLWPSDPVAGPIAVSAAFGSATLVVLALALRRAGLAASHAGLLALVAAAAPLAGWQTGSPMGGAPASLASAILLWWFARQQRPGRHDGPAPLPLRRRWAVGLSLGLLIVVADAIARRQGASTAKDLWALVQGDLGAAGLLLLLPSLGRADATVPAGRIWLGTWTLVLLTTPLPAMLRAALVAPWAWWIAGAGLRELLAMRGARASHWAVLGLVLWIGMQAARVPWGHQRQQAALTRTWTEGLVAHVDAAHPVVDDGSARAALLAALVRHRSPAAASATVTSVNDAWAATRDGRQPLVTGAATLDTLRWGGLGFAQVDDAGSPIEEVLRALPVGVVTVAVISAGAASAITPAQWQALGRVGLRLPDAGVPRAHALVGITGARGEGLEAARTGSVQLDVQPGDPVGRTGARSPVDARLQAGPTRVSVALRGAPFIEDAEGLALLFFSTRGELLAWRTGRRPDLVSGPALGRGPTVAAVAVAALPCVEVAAGGSTDILPLTAAGALGVAWHGPGRLDVTLRRPTGAAGERVRLAAPATPAPAPILTQDGDAPLQVALEGRTGAPWGVHLGGPVEQARASALSRVRLCAAWSLPHAVSLGRGPVEVLASPRDEPHFGIGWHGPEVAGRGAYFRWMSGSRAELVIALREATALTFTLDAQSPDAPAAGDEVRLALNGRDLGPKPLLEDTGGLYTWHVDAAATRRGMNTFTLSTTLTRRPADRTPGGDPRLLGLLVRRWLLSPVAARPLDVR